MNQIIIQRELEKVHYGQYRYVWRVSASRMLNHYPVALMDLNVWDGSPVAVRLYHYLDVQPIVWEGLIPSKKIEHPMLSNYVVANIDSLQLSQIALILSGGENHEE